MRIHNKLLWGLSTLKGVATESGGLYFLLNGQYPILGAAMAIGGGIMMGIGIANIICGENKYYEIGCKCEEKKPDLRKKDAEQKVELITSPVVSENPGMDYNYNREIFRNEKPIQLVSAEALKSPSQQSNNSYEPIK
jgi:hypothetical protein